MGSGGIYAGWSHAGIHRWWVRVPAGLKERSNGHRRAATVGDRAQTITEPYWGRSPLNGAGGDLEGPPLVPVHGIATSSRGLEPLIRELGRRRPVFAPDLPGFGRTDPPARPLDVTGLAEALRAWLIHNRITPAVIVGTSFGCHVAAALAATHPALVERLVLVSPTDPAERERRGYPLRWARSSPRLAATAVRNVLDAGPWQAARALEDARRDPLPDKLRGVRAPTLLIRGSRDRLSTEQWLWRLAAEIPNGRIETLERAGHMPANGAVSGVTAAIESFLAEEHEPVEYELPLPEFQATEGAAEDDTESGSDPAPTDGGRWIVDAMNVIGSRPDGWWRDRPRAWRNLARLLDSAAREGGGDFVLVIDGHRPHDWRGTGLIETSFAGTGPGAADDAIVARVKADPHPEALRVVTSDRALADRVRELGAEAVGAARFRDRLD